MSNINMQDNIIKSSLVQQIQHRGEDIARVQAQNNLAASEELARQADEVVLQLNQAENEGIRDDDESGEPDQRERRRRQRRSAEEETPEETGPPSAADGRHHIDITI